MLPDLEQQLGLELQVKQFDLMLFESPKVVLEVFEVFARKSLGLKHFQLEVLVRKSPDIFEVVRQ